MLVSLLRVLSPWFYAIPDGKPPGAFPGVTIALLAVLSAWAANAAASASVGLAEPVPGLHGTTYLDLVRQVVPDVAPAGSSYQGKTVIDVRHIAGDDAAAGPPGTIRVSTVETLPVQSDGKDRLLVMLELGEAEGAAQGYVVLALFNLAGSPTLLDAADIGFDRLTSFQAPGRISLGEGKNVVLTSSQHFNSSQGYVTTAMILIRNDRLQLIDTVFTFNDRFCGFDRDQTPAFRAGDRDGRTYSDLVATVTEIVKPNGETCDAEEGLEAKTRTIEVIYRWDETLSLFKPNSDAFEVLAKENAERF